MKIKYDNKLLYEIEFKDKKEKVFPYKLFYLIPDNVKKNIKDLLIKEFIKNIKLFKFFNNNKIIVKKFKVYLTENNENCFDSSLKLLGDGMIKKNELYTSNNENNLKIFYITNMKIKKYLKNIIPFFEKKEEISISIDDFSYEELLLIKKLYLSSLLDYMNKFKEGLVYDKNYNVYYLKFKQLIMIQTRLKKIKMINNYIKEKNKEFNN